VIVVNIVIKIQKAGLAVTFRCLKAVVLQYFIHAVTPVQAGNKTTRRNVNRNGVHTSDDTGCFHGDCLRA